MRGTRLTGIEVEFHMGVFLPFVTVVVWSALYSVWSCLSVSFFMVSLEVRRTLEHCAWKDWHSESVETQARSAQ